MSIRLTNITKQYGEQKAVDNISFHINKGEIVGFLGPNGAGKSTTMKMITGYITPDSGTIEINENNITNSNINFKKSIGYLPESNALYTDMYVMEYLEFVGGLYQINNLKKRIEEIIQLVGLTIERKKKIEQLSKGYKQRVGLASVLLNEPDILILDEPTSGLDPNQVIEIRQLIKMLSKNKTVIFSTHILQEVEALCDKVLIINKGKIMTFDTLSQLKQNTTRCIEITFKEYLAYNDLKECLAFCERYKKENDKWLFYINNTIENFNQKIMQKALQQGWTIKNISESPFSLEHIFQQFTQDL